MKKLLAFDLDNTLAVSKSPIDSEMKDILSELLFKYKIGIITSGNYQQVKEYVVDKLNKETNFQNLFLLPTCGTKFYSFDENNIINLIYSKPILDEERQRIINVFKKVLSDLNFIADKVYGDQFEDRETQITFSALGQDAPHEIKKDWDPKKIKRNEIKNELHKHLENYDIFINGSTSIDILQKGLDKSFGMMKLLEFNKFTHHDAIYFGDSMGIDGNDYPVIKTEVECVAVGNPQDTKNYLRNLL